MEVERIGKINKLARYPIKSMASFEMEQSLLGWHGMAGDRRIGVRQLDSSGSFPWVTARRVPELLLYKPTDFDSSSSEPIPQQIKTPAGKLLPLNSKELADEIGTRIGSGVELMPLKHGIFDDAEVSLITTQTAFCICDEAGVRRDSRRFRANIEVECDNNKVFAEDGWVNSVVIIGDAEKGPAIFITKRDTRCKMICVDPETAENDPGLLKTTTQLNGNTAGVYAKVIRDGTLRIGDSVYLVNGLYDNVSNEKYH